MKKNLGAVIKSLSYITDVDTLTVSSRIGSTVIHQDSTKSDTPPFAYHSYIRSHCILRNEKSEAEDLPL